MPSPSGTLKSAATTLRDSDGSGSTGTSAEAVAERSRTSSPADGYSVRLVASRVLYDGGTAVTTVGSLAALVVPGSLRANPQDLADLGVSAGGRVRLRSATASAEVPVEPDPSLSRKVVAADFNVPLGDGTVADLIDRTFPVVDLRMESL